MYKNEPNGTRMQITKKSSIREGFIDTKKPVSTETIVFFSVLGLVVATAAIVYVVK
jgi:hypothetical protein